MPLRSRRRYPLSLAGLVVAACGIRGTWPCFAQTPEPAPAGLRRHLLGGAVLGLAGPQAAVADGFSVGSLGPKSLKDGAAAQFQVVEKPKNELTDAIVLISRVQEATVQEERLVTTGKFKDVQRNDIKRALNMMIKNYGLADQVVKASAYVEQPNKMMEATTVGNEAVDALETCRDYFNTNLKVDVIGPQQRDFVVKAMGVTRTKLDGFLRYLPQDQVDAARRQVEEENAMNMKEFQGEDGSILNPVAVPWKKGDPLPR